MRKSTAIAAAPAPIRRSWRQLSPALAGTCALAFAGTIWAGTSSVTLESQHTDLLDSATNQYQHFNVSDADSDSAPTVAIALLANNRHESSFQDVSFYAAAFFADKGGVITLGAEHREQPSLSGTDYQHRWIASFTQLSSTVGYTDFVLPSSRHAPQSMEFVWRLTAAYTHRIDIDPGHRPLYRLENLLRFRAGGDGVAAPINLNAATYDPHADASPPQYTWSFMQDDVATANASVFGSDGMLVSLKVEPRRDPLTGELLPNALYALIELDSRYDFLNESSEFNLYLRGELAYEFSNSADLLGVIVRDANGDILTDVVMQSAEGLHYTILDAYPSSAPIPEPATWALLLAGLGWVSWRQAGRAPRSAAQ